ncbi:MAG: DUF3025 domain-containing protein [Pseudomonadota bacterium]|jgi:hypothetical protein
MTSAPGWDRDFARHRPFFAALEPRLASLARLPDFPGRAQADAWLRESDDAIRDALGQSLTLVAPDARAGARDYERAIADRGELAWRERDWHDLMNLLAWLAFPRTKAAINAGHVASAAEVHPASGRGPRRDALTLFDESGALVACSDPGLLDLLRGFRWRELFVEHREAVRTQLRVLVVGHGLLDRCRQPWPGMTAHALCLPVSAAECALDAPALGHVLDERMAGAVAALATPRDLSPLPLMGIPGWCADNEDPAFYGNTRIFRPGRRA